MPLVPPILSNFHFFCLDLNLSWSTWIGLDLWFCAPPHVSYHWSLNWNNGPWSFWSKHEIFYHYFHSQMFPLLFPCIRYFTRPWLPLLSFATRFSSHKLFVNKMDKFFHFHISFKPIIILKISQNIIFFWNDEIWVFFLNHKSQYLNSNTRIK